MHSRYIFLFFLIFSNTNEKCFCDPVYWLSLIPRYLAYTYYILNKCTYGNECLAPRLRGFNFKYRTHKNIAYSRESLQYRIDMSLFCVFNVCQEHLTCFNLFHPNTFNQLQADWLSKLKPPHKHWTLSWE
jgi:hypothetical protein